MREERERASGRRLKQRRKKLRAEKRSGVRGKRARRNTERRRRREGGCSPRGAAAHTHKSRVQRLSGESIFSLAHSRSPYLSPSVTYRRLDAYVYRATCTAKETIGFYFSWKSSSPLSLSLATPVRIACICIYIHGERSERESERKPTHYER